MIYYVVLNGKLPSAKVVQDPRTNAVIRIPGKERLWQDRGYISVNNIAQEQERPLRTQLWRILFNNTRLTDLIIAFQYWTQEVDNVLRFNIGHGIRTTLYDISNGESKLVCPIANLPRNEGYDKQSKIHRCTECGTRFQGKSCPSCYIIHEAPTPLLDAVHAVMAEIGDTKFRFSRREGRDTAYCVQLKRQNQQSVLASLTGQEQSEEASAMAKAISHQLNIKVILDRMQRWAQPYIRRMEADPNGYWKDIPLENPLRNSESLVAFAQGWAWLYDLPTPQNDCASYITAGQLLTYINEGIKPSKPLREEPAQAVTDRIVVSDVYPCLREQYVCPPVRVKGKLSSIKFRKGWN